MDDLWLYFRAVLDQWVALMSGGIITVALALWERYQQKTISAKWYVAIIAFFVLLSMFLAWRDRQLEVRKLTQQLIDERKKNNPDLGCSIEMISTGTDLNAEQPSFVVTLFIAVTNQGAPSIAHGWQLFIVMPDQTLEVLPRHYGGTTTLDLPGRSPLVFTEDEFIYNKIGSNPLATGGMASGILMFKVTGVSKEEFNSLDPDLRLEFKDIAGRSYTVLHKHGEGIPGNLLYLPGVKTSPQQREQQ